MHYYDLDPVGQKIFQTEPEGMKPDEQIICAGVRLYFIMLSQEERKKTLNALMEPKMYSLYQARVDLTAADVDREVLMHLAEICTHQSIEMLKIGDQAEEYRALAAHGLEEACRRFDAEKMSKGMEKYLRELYMTIVAG